MDTIYKINDKEFEYIVMAIGVLPIFENEPISHHLAIIPRRMTFKWCFYDLPARSMQGRIITKIIIRAKTIGRFALAKRPNNNYGNNNRSPVLRTRRPNNYGNNNRSPTASREAP